MRTPRVAKVERGAQKKAPAFRQEPNGGWMRGCVRAFHLVRRGNIQKSLQFHAPASLRRTSSLSALPSTCAPENFAVRAFMTLPMSLGDAAPVS